MGRLLSSVLGVKDFLQELDVQERSDVLGTSRLVGLDLVMK
jgi:hypothetical protein